MTREARSVRSVAVAIVESETNEEQDDTQQLEAAERILAAFQDEIVRLIGDTGFHALLDRSFHRSAADQGIAAQARPPTRSADYLRKLRDNIHSVPSTDSYSAMIAVLTELLSLLTRFIGADITAALVRRTWPHLAWLTPAHLEDAAADAGRDHAGN